jgi:hypothetical protein
MRKTDGQAYWDGLPRETQDSIETFAVIEALSELYKKHILEKMQKEADDLKKSGDTSPYIDFAKLNEPVEMATTQVFGGPQD